MLYPHGGKARTFCNRIDKDGVGVWFILCGVVKTRLQSLHFLQKACQYVGGVATLLYTRQHLGLRAVLHINVASVLGLHDLQLLWRVLLLRLVGHMTAVPKPSVDHLEVELIRVPVPCLPNTHPHQCELAVPLWEALTFSLRRWR